MRILNGKVAAIAMGAGLFTGMLAASSPAGASLLPIVPTTTAVSVSSVNNFPSSVTATVSLELVNGLLITPSGSVAFTNVDRGTTYLLGSAPLSKCLLGLPSLLGITQATCSATVSLSSQCFIGTLYGFYSAASDLIAEPSVGSLVLNDNTQRCD